MPFDPQREDYQRMGLLFANSLTTTNPVEVARSFAKFGRQFAQDRDKLPQTDDDRAFHLVANATALIDYQLPFASDAQAQKLIDQAHVALEEALKLDPRNPDALRMERASQIPSFEGYYDYLREHREEARATCEERAQRAREAYDGDRQGLACMLAMAPYLRWLAALASKAIVCGHNHAALDYCHDLLDLDPTDAAGANRSAAIAYAKLEDQEGLAGLLPQVHGRTARPAEVRDAWLLISLCALCYKNYDLDGAQQLVDALCRSYPHAPITLYLQRELPDGVFSRLAVDQGSEDELILAVSECTVLLQEGRDSSARGSFGAWMMREADKRLTSEDRRSLQDFLSEEAAGEGTQAPLDDRGGSGVQGPGSSPDPGVGPGPLSDGGRG